MKNIKYLKYDNLNHPISIPIYVYVYGEIEGSKLVK